MVLPRYVFPYKTIGSVGSLRKGTIGSVGSFYTKLSGLWVLTIGSVGFSFLCIAIHHNVLSVIYLPL